MEKTLTLRNGKVLTVKSDESLYDNGHETGLTWDGSWVPGGPFVFTVRHNSDPVWAEYCAASASNHKAWLRGWLEGVIAGAAENPNPWVQKELSSLAERRNRGH